MVDDLKPDPIILQREVVRRVGYNAAAFLEALTEHGPEEKSWYAYDPAGVERKYALSREEQHRAITALDSLCILKERRDGTENFRTFYVDLFALAEEVYGAAR
jgi:hypothetical protein